MVADIPKERATLDFGSHLNFMQKFVADVEFLLDSRQINPTERRVTRHSRTVENVAVGDNCLWFQFCDKG